MEKWTSFVEGTRLKWGMVKQALYQVKVSRSLRVVSKFWLNQSNL